MKRKFNLPGGTVYSQFESMINQTHLLIAGTTGSGKSVLTNNLIYTAMLHGPGKYQFVFIDSKGIELNQYQNTLQCIAYADHYNTIAAAIHNAHAIMETRFRKLKRTGEKKYTGHKIVIVIDEYVDISLNLKKANKYLHKQVENDLIAILSRGRAAGIVVWLCTQRPTKDVITGVIKANLPSKIALHTESKQESINIIGCTYAAELPAYGQCEYYTPDVMSIKRYDIPLIPEEESKRVIEHWNCYKLPWAWKIIQNVLN